MVRAAKFEIVSIGQFSSDYIDFYKDSKIIVQGQDADSAYDKIVLPKRATSGSAGYDIISPVSFVLAPGESIKVATGLRCRMSEGWAMLLLPKSGLGTKFRLQLDNTVGLVDPDYYGAKNEGHIIVALTNDSKSGKTVEIPAGKAVCQAVFVNFGITEDDDASGTRTGGFGSTNA